MSALSFKQRFIPRTLFAPFVLVSSTPSQIALAQGAADVRERDGHA